MFFVLLLVSLFVSLSVGLLQTKRQTYTKLLPEVCFGPMND